MDETLRVDSKQFARLLTKSLPKPPTRAKIAAEWIVPGAAERVTRHMLGMASS